MWPGGKEKRNTKKDENQLYILLQVYSACRGNRILLLLIDYCFLDIDV